MRITHTKGNHTIRLSEQDNLPGEPMWTLTNNKPEDKSLIDTLETQQISNDEYIAIDITLLLNGYTRGITS